MTGSRWVGRPDPDQARRELPVAVGELRAAVRGLVAERVVAADRLRGNDKRRGWAQQAAQLVQETIREWNDRTSRMLSDAGDDEGAGLVSAAFQTALDAHGRLRDAHDLGYDGPYWGFTAHATAGEVRPILHAVRAGLADLGPRLATTPPPAQLPVVHPPGFARLKDDEVAEAVDERLAELVTSALAQYRTPRLVEYPEQPRQPAFHQLFERALQPFLTTEVLRRYRLATGRFGGVEALGGAHPRSSFGRDYETYRRISRGIHARMYAAHLAIAVNYLAEVRELMPKYARDSGQAEPLAPVTVNGPVGQVNVAHTITNIGTSAEAVAQRGETEAAAALRALSEAIRQAPDLVEETRAELLDHLADLAEGAAEPAQPRLRSRAKAALAALTAAAGASSQVAQAVTSWHEVLSRLF